MASAATVSPLNRPPWGNLHMYHHSSPNKPAAAGSTTAAPTADEPKGPVTAEQVAAELIKAIPTVTTTVVYTEAAGDCKTNGPVSHSVVTESAAIRGGCGGEEG